MAAPVRTPVLGPLPVWGYLAELTGSLAGLPQTCPQPEHSKMRRSGPLQLDPMRTSIMRRWQAGQSGRGIGISDGSGRA